MKVARHARVAPCAELIAWLERAHVEDKSAERMAKIFGVLAIIFVIGGFAFPPAFVIAIPCAVMWWLNRQHDIDDQKLAAATRLLRILRADVSPTHHVKLQVDFRSYMHKAFQRRAGAYAQPWLSLRARLEDGNELRVEVVRQGKVKRKPKRKYTKVKERVSDLILLRLKVNRERYPDPAAFAVVAPRHGAPRGLQLRRIRAVDGELQADFATPEGRRITGRTTTDFTVPASGDFVLTALLWTYRGLKKEKAEAIGARA